ncbi:MAG: NHLP bacteriocin export ABC transporter permease/ATPase subunit [Desulfobacteraceae bacterium]|nr:MAG: NHLP bacteriocin export ABC transporter permease/ATPase subunit [Desulfobacteraceae bacterium]
MKLQEIFERQGEVRQVSGNTPVLLQGKANVWFVLSGQLEVFAVQLEGERLVGPKKHFFAARQGELLFGMDLESWGFGQGFQAVGFPGTRMARLDLSHLIALGANPDCREELARVLNGWVNGLSEGLTADIVPRPRADVLLEPREGVSLKGDRIAFPAGEVLWIGPRSGSALFVSMEEVSADGQDGFFPLCPKSWLRNIGESVIDVIRTEEALSCGIVWHSLERFHALIFQILLFNMRFEAVDRYNLMEEKAEMDRAAKEQGLAELACILDKRMPPIPACRFDDPLLAACGLVGQRLGVFLREPPRAKRPEEKASYTLEDAARIWGVHFRRVALRDEWWRRDNGPLVAFLEKEKDPVALLPLSGSRYEKVDPQTGSRERITAKSARELAPFAYTLYRHFPDKKLSGRDILCFGLAGSARSLIWVLLLGGAIGLSSLIVPIATGFIFSDIIPGAERIRLIQLVLILACFAFTTFLFEITRNMVLLGIESRMGYWVESALWDRILRLPTTFFRRFTAGNLALRGMGFSMIRQMITGAVVTGMIGSLFSLFNYALLFYYHAKLALVATIPLLLFFTLMAAIVSFQLKFFRRMADTAGTISGYVFQFLNAIAKLRVSGSEDRAFSIWSRHFRRQKELAYQGGIGENVLKTASAILPLLSLIPIFSWLILYEKDAVMETGDFLAFIAAFSNLQGSLFQIVIMLNMVIIAVPFYERIQPILECVPEVDAVKSDPGELNGKIELCNILFRYSREGPLVLKGVSLRVEPGEFVAVVGPSGSGKSTLIRLLLGFEKPDSGTIYFDDQDLSDLDVTRVRQNLGVVLQGGNIMPGDIFTNIVGNRPLTQDHAWEAARMAGLDEDIKQMPMGMHTVVMEGGSTLSGGQRQRLMIARSIVNRPRILIFDEATSALDNRTQATVSSSLKRLKASRIVIAHRLSTILDADRIYVLDAGEIAEQGTYEDLMARGGTFEKLARRQIV